MSESADALFAGYLEKRSTKTILGVRAWQKRYFVLTSKAFTGYRTKKDYKDGLLPLESVPFDALMSAMVPLDSEKGCRLDVHAEGAERVFELRADTPDESTRWVAVIRTALQAHGGYKSIKDKFPISPAPVPKAEGAPSSPPQTLQSPSPMAVPTPSPAVALSSQSLTLDSKSITLQRAPSFASPPSNGAAAPAPTPAAVPVEVDSTGASIADLNAAFGQANTPINLASPPIKFAFSPSELSSPQPKLPETFAGIASNAASSAVAHIVRATPSLLLDTVYEQLTCQLCQEPFNLENRRPKVLACGHSFDSICLEVAMIRQVEQKEGERAAQIQDTIAMMNAALSQQQAADLEIVRTRAMLDSVIQARHAAELDSVNLVHKRERDALAAKHAVQAEALQNSLRLQKQARVTKEQEAKRQLEFRRISDGDTEEVKKASHDLNAACAAAEAAEHDSSAASLKAQRDVQQGERDALQQVHQEKLNAIGLEHRDQIENSNAKIVELQNDIEAAQRRVSALQPILDELTDENSLQQLRAKPTSLKCPLCSTHSSLASRLPSNEGEVVPTGLAVLPDNYFCCSLIEHMQRPVSHTKPTKCAECRGKRIHTSTHRCVQCRTSLCLGHVHLHDDSHVLVPHAASTSMGRESTLLMQCATHGKELDFFCATCLVPVCVSCVVLNSGAHRFHEAVEMEQVRSETVADVTSLVDQARQRANELEAREVEFQNARQEMLTVRVSGADAIRHRFDVLIAHLQAKRDEMIVQHQVLVDANVSIADDSIQALQTTHQYLHTIAAFTGRELEVERQRIRAEEDVLAGDLAVHDTPDGVTPAESTPGPSDYSTPAADVPNASPAAVAGIKKFFRSHLQATLEQKVVNFSRTVMLNAIRGQLRQSLLEASDAQVSLWPVAVRATLAAEDPEAIPPSLTESLGLLDVARVDISMTQVSGSIFAAVSSDELVNPMPRAVRVPVEGERIRLQLQLRDADRRAFKEGAWTWSPFVRTTLSEQADGTTAPLELAPGYQQVDLHDGLYEVSFEARQGQWELLLLARDQWLPAIPFTCTAPIATALLSRIVGAGEAVLVDVDSTNQNAPLAMLNPSGVAYDAKNDLLIVTDQGQHRVVAIKRQNDEDQLVWQFGKTQLPGDGDSELNEPMGCAVHAATNTVAICDAGNDRCLLLRASDGKPLAMLGGSGSEEGQFCRPESCAFSDDGKHLWITDALNARVQCLNVNTGEMVRCIGGGAAAIFEHPNAVAVLGDRIFVSDAVKRHVLVFGSNLTAPLFTIGAAVSLSSISHISACSSRRYVYITDADAARVHVFSAAASSSSTDPSQLYRYLGVAYPSLSELGTLRPISVCAGGNVVCVTDAVRHQVLMWSWSQ